MITFKFTSVAFIGIALLIGTGCASKPKEVGFISTYANLQPKSDTELVYLGPKLGQYSKFIIDQITVKSYDAQDMAKLKPDDIEHLRSFFYDTLQKDLSAKYPVVFDKGPGVARLRIAITDLKKGNPALNVLPQTKITGLGLGAASTEMEMVDSQTGEQIAAAIVSQTGSRLSLSGLTEWGDAEAVMKDWSKRIVANIEEAHGGGAK